MLMKTLFTMIQNLWRSAAEVKRQVNVFVLSQKYLVRRQVSL